MLDLLDRIRHTLTYIFLMGVALGSYTILLHFGKRLVSDFFQIMSIKIAINNESKELRDSRNISTDGRVTTNVQRIQGFFHCT